MDRSSQPHCREYQNAVLNAGNESREASYSPIPQRSNYIFNGADIIEATSGRWSFFTSSYICNGRAHF